MSGPSETSPISMPDGPPATIDSAEGGLRPLEARLQAAEARYRCLFEYAQVGILLADDDSVYVDANQAACRMLGDGS